MKDLQAIAQQLGLESPLPSPSPKRKKLPPDQYAKKKDRERLRQKSKSEKSRDIAATCPVCRSIVIRNKIRKSLIFALKTLFPQRFNLAFSKDQLEFVKDVEDCIKSGGQLARAMPRATGKTSILICAVIWAILSGHHQFVALIGATAKQAKFLLEQIATQFETNDELYAYFPELVHPIRKLQGISQRRLLWKGQRIKQIWNKDRIVLPDFPPGPGAGAVIAVGGLDGSLRGFNYDRTDGANVRPSLVLVDDPQTRRSAASVIQNQKREQILNGDILGLSGPKTRIAVLVACTVIHPNDLADRILDREKNPAWQGKRTKLLKSLPTNLDLWDEYAELLRAGLRDGTGRTKATAFYRKRRRKMDEGALAAWPARFEPGQISAIQYAMDIRILNRESFEAEYQNTPLRVEDESGKLITADELMLRINKLGRGEIPAYAEHITAGIDVHQDILYWMICWWTKNFKGGITDYGETPEQHRHYFQLTEANPTLMQLTKRTAVLPAVRAGLDPLIAKIMNRKFKRADGVEMRVERLLIDANWGQSTDTVYDACRESDFAQNLRPAHGKGLKVTDKPMATWKVGQGETNGLHWIRKTNRGVRFLTIDTNYQKTFVHNGLNLKPEEDHSISIFKAEPHEHRMLFDHLTSETRKRPKTEDGRTVDLWFQTPSKENHRFDNLVQCAVGADELGVKMLPPKQAPKIVPQQARYWNDN